jgi:ArsR family transcriptional regulator
MNFPQAQRLLKALSEATRLRILMLLRGKELCVCQLVAALGQSQPLVSRHLTVLREAGLLQARRKGKLMFYRLRPRKGLEASLLRALTKALAEEPQVRADLEALTECTEFQRRTGRCGMKAFEEFMRTRRRARP